MIKKLILPLAGTAAFILAVGIFLQKASVLPSTSTPQNTTSKPTVTIGQTTVNVELAKTKSEKEKGLSNRSSLEGNSGMLFVFKTNEGAPSFWMKKMEIPLDIIWIRGGKIIKIDKNIPAPAPNTIDSDLKIYSAGTIVDYVLEVNAGFSDSNSIKTGDSVTFAGI